MTEDKDLRVLVAEVAKAYFANSHVTPTEIPTVIRQIAASLGALGGEPASIGAEDSGAAQRKLTPAQIRRSIGPDALISFEDNKSYKTLRRHLAVKGLSPEQYREKWGLPKDYPMVAPSYSEARSRLARAAGLGARQSAPAASPAAKAQPASPPPAAVSAAAESASAAPTARKPAGRKTAGRKARGATP